MLVSVPVLRVIWNKTKNEMTPQHKVQDTSEFVTAKPRYELLPRSLLNGYLNAFRKAVIDLLQGTVP
jgi:hypothetical protein